MLIHGLDRRVPLGPLRLQGLLGRGIGVFGKLAQITYEPVELVPFVLPQHVDARTVERVRAVLP